MIKSIYTIIVLLLVNNFAIAKTGNTPSLSSLKSVFEDFKLISDNDEYYKFGSSVSLDGNMAAIGARGENLTGYRGAVHVFKYENNIWNEIAKIDSLGAEVFHIGSSVSLKGSRLLIGSMPANSSDAGRAFVFDYDGTNWNLSATLIPNDNSTYNGSAGENVSLSDDGTRALIGDRNYQDSSSDGFTRTGAAYVFDFDGTDWSQTAQLLPSDPHGDNEFTSAVSLSGDRVAIGSFFNNGTEYNGSQAGAVYIYENNAGTWTQTVKLIQSTPQAQDWFGGSVSLEGNRLLVGASGVDDTAPQAGAAFVFDYNGTSWVETQKILADTGDSYFLFGTSVSLENNKALIGAPQYNTETLFNSGAAYLFELKNNTWTQSDILLASDASNYDNFGWSASLSGGLSLIGAIFDDENATAAGSAYIIKTGLIFKHSFE